VPSLPGSELTWTSSVWLTAVAAALAVGGLFAFRHRDLQSD
jgi:putative exporter of polyketide antibiotics